MDRELVGYLLEALDPDEIEQVEQLLQSDPELRTRVDLLRRRLTLLEVARVHVEAPTGLAQRTCQQICAKRNDEPE